RSGVHERYAREWLEQQAVTGLLTAHGDGTQRRFGLPEACREVLLDRSSLNYLAPVARMLAASAAKMPQLLQAYRTGGGVSWYDAVFAFECVHDLSDPVAFLATARRATADDGVTVVMDEAVAPEFTAPGDELERIMYGFSLLVCLPDGMSQQPSAATGTVMRES